PTAPSPAASPSPSAPSRSTSATSSASSSSRRPTPTTAASSPSSPTSAHEIPPARRYLTRITPNPAATSQRQRRADPDRADPDNVQQLTSSPNRAACCCGRGSGNGVTVGGQRDVHGAPGGVGVRAHLVRCGDEPRRLLAIADLWQGHVELHREDETTLRGGQQAHPAVDRDITHLGALAAADHAQSALEAGRIAHSEQLFGVGTAALAAHLLRRAELHI